MLLLPLVKVFQIIQLVLKVHLLPLIITRINLSPQRRPNTLNRIQLKVLLE